MYVGHVPRLQAIGIRLHQQYIAVQGGSARMTIMYVTNRTWLSSVRIAPGISEPIRPAGIKVAQSSLLSLAVVSAMGIVTEGEARYEAGVVWVSYFDQRSHLMVKDFLFPTCNKTRSLLYHQSYVQPPSSGNAPVPLTGRLKCHHKDLNVMQRLY